MDGVLARRYALLKQMKEQHERDAKALGKLMEQFSADLYAQFTDDGIMSYRLAAQGPGDKKPIFLDGSDRILKPEAKPKPSVPAERHGEFLDWMRSEGFQALIKENINAATLSKWVVQRQTENQPLPPMMNVFVVETVKITRAPKR